MDSAAGRPSMPWNEVSIMEQRREFVRLAMQEGTNRRELCRRFGIHPDTGYKWLGRWTGGERELSDRSRRPHASPGRTQAVTEERVLAVRDAHPAWGARKIARCLERDGHLSPAISTVHEILRRHGRVEAAAGRSGQAFQRFEKPAPNLLWQMDFKGWVELANGVRCHPLTMVDDHSRYSLCLKACDNQQSRTVQAHLDTTFRRYGLPDAMFVDNGTPWGDSSGARWTRQSVAAERRVKMSLHGPALLIVASLEAKRIARMIVHHCQRMAAHSIRQLHPALEVHLPEKVRRRLLKPLKRLTGPPRRRL